LKAVIFSGLFFISSLVILYSDYYIHGDLNVNSFILLVLMFMMPGMFSVVRLNIIRILLGWSGLSLTSHCLVIYH